MTTIEKTENKTIVDEMFNAGAHFGYSKSKRHASMKSIIFGMKNKVEIINLEKTDKFLADAIEFVSSLASEGKQILFVGSKNEGREAIKSSADAIGMPYVFNRWIGGTITNFSEIKKRIARLEDLTLKKEKGELAMYTKKERLLIDREIEGLERHFGGLLLMKHKPAAVFVVDSKHEKIAVKEAMDSGIPVIALSGSDCNLKAVNYPIPANDASRTSITFFVNQIKDAYDKSKVSQPEVKSEAKPEIKK